METKKETHVSFSFPLVCCPEGTALRAVGCATCPHKNRSAQKPATNTRQERATDEGKKKHTAHGVQFGTNFKLRNH